MRKIIAYSIIIIFFTLISLTIILSTIGVETDRFNNLISKKINQNNNNIALKLTAINFKLDLKEISLFLETKNSQISYRNILIPTEKIKVYMDFLSLIKVEPKIKKINLVVSDLDIEQLKKISVTFKPSNFTSFLNNKIKKGQLTTEFKIYLDNDNLLENFTASGSVKNLKAEILKDIDIEKTNFDFFTDKTDILLKNISSEGGPFKIIDGDLKIDISKEISLRSNFKTKLKLNKESKKYINLIEDFKYKKNIIGFEADLNNSLVVNFDNTYKVKSYNFKNNGQISKFTLDFKDPLNNYFLNEEIKQLSLTNSQIETSFNFQKNKINISGKYSINKDDPLSFNLNSVNDKKTSNIEFKADYKKPFELDFINYKKSANSVANIFIDLKKKKNITEIKKFNLIEGKNIISIENLELNKNKIIFLKNINVKTIENGKINNGVINDANKILQLKDFKENILKISYGKKKHYLIKII